ncbi:MAG: DNA-3-methyladenine glycosylase I, partial [Psychroflexus sp.]
AAINNAKCVKKVQKEHGSFNDFLWSYVDHKPLQTNFMTINDVPSETELSQKICKDLKKKGFKFVGPTIIYAFMQATGMTNDHLLECPSR